MREHLHRLPVHPAEQLLVATGSGAPTGLLLGASGLLAAAGAAVVVAVRRRAMES